MINLTNLSDNAIRSAGDLYFNLQSGRSFKGLSSGTGTNTIRVPAAEPVSMGDQLQARSGNYFVTDIQNDNACKILSIFKITHTLTNVDTAESIPAHLGTATAGQATFWIPSRYDVAIGQDYRNGTGTYRVSAVNYTGNNGNAVYCDILP